MDLIFNIKFNLIVMTNYTRVMLGLIGLCALGLMTLGYILRLDALFVFGTILGCGFTVIGIVDAVTKENNEEI